MIYSFYLYFFPGFFSHPFFLPIIHRVEKRAGAVANALFPAPPRQTVHSVFPNTAFRSSSSGGFRSLSPWSGGWNLVEIQILIKVLIWILAIASVFLRLLPSQVDAYSFFQKPFDRGQVSAAVPIV